MPTQRPFPLSPFGIFSFWLPRPKSQECRGLKSSSNKFKGLLGFAFIYSQVDVTQPCTGVVQPTGKTWRLVPMGWNHRVTQTPRAEMTAGSPSATVQPPPIALTKSYPSRCAAAWGGTCSTILLHPSLPKKTLHVHCYNLTMPLEQKLIIGCCKNDGPAAFNGCENYR